MGIIYSNDDMGIQVGNGGPPDLSKVPMSQLFTMKAMKQEAIDRAQAEMDRIEAEILKRTQRDE